MAHDKDVTGVLKMLPKDAKFYWTQASVRRAMDCDELKMRAETCGLTGESYPDVNAACNAAFANAHEDDTIFVAGSSFIVADLLKSVKIV